jgi:3-hydroxybutyrate dehydrogenase
LEGFLAGKTSIVTGSTSGIGLGIAESLASRGSNIVLSGSRSEEQAKALVEELSTKYEVKVVYCQADLSNPMEAAEKLFACALKTFGGVDILGISFLFPFSFLFCVF